MYVSALGDKLLYVKNIEDVVKVTTQIKILDICNEFFQRNNFRRHFISIT